MRISKLMLAICCSLFISHSAMAHGSEGEAENTTKKLSIENQMLKQIHSPFFTQQTMGVEVAEISFRIRNDFSLMVERIHSNDLRLEVYLQAELSKMKILIEKENIGKTFTIRLRFP